MAEIRTCEASLQHPGRCCQTVEHAERRLSGLEKHAPLARYAMLLDHHDEEPGESLIEHLVCEECAAEAHERTLFLMEDGDATLVGMKTYRPRPGYAPALVARDR